MSSTRRAHGTGRTIVICAVSIAGIQPIGGASKAETSGDTAKGEPPRGQSPRHRVKRNVEARAPRAGERSEQRGVGAAHGSGRARPQRPKLGIAPQPLPREIARGERRERAIGRRQMKMLIAGHQSLPRLGRLWRATFACRRLAGTNAPGQKGQSLSRDKRDAILNSEPPANKRQSRPALAGRDRGLAGISRGCRGSDATRSGCRSRRPRRRRDWRRSER